MDGKFTLTPEVQRRVNKWLEGPYDAETKKQIRYLLENEPGALSDSFYKNLSFGTAGLRGVMGIGTNRLNEYTIRSATGMHRN